MKTRHTYTEGQIVAYAAKWLRSIGWYTDVPRNGIVRAVRPWSDYDDLVTVEWCDGYTCKVISANLWPYDRLHVEPA